MDMYSFLLGLILGIGIPLAVVEVRKLLAYYHANKRFLEEPRGWASEPPWLQCPLPSPHSRHDERVCAIAWYINHQNRTVT
jgi:hypothetical protein